jgi:pilus assembly protein Flp/PilA
MPLITTLKARFDDRGASMVEYGLLVALIAIVALSAISMTGNKTKDQFTVIAAGLDGQAPSGSAAITPDEPGDTAGGSSGGAVSDDEVAPTDETGDVGSIDEPSGSGDPEDSGGIVEAGGSAGGESSEPAGETTTTTTVLEEVVIAPPGSVTQISATGSEFYWYNGNKNNGNGAWKASLTFSNEWIRHQYLSLEVTRVDQSGKTTTMTVNDFYVPAGGSATYENWDNALQFTKGNPNGVVSVSVKVLSIRTSDIDWKTVSYPVTDGTPTSVTAPQVK